MSRADDIIAAEAAKQQIRELLEHTPKPPATPDPAGRPSKPIWTPPPGRMEDCDGCHQPTDVRNLKLVQSPIGPGGWATLCPRCR